MNVGSGLARAGAVPLDLLATEQDRVARRLALLDAQINAGDVETQTGDVVGLNNDLLVVLAYHNTNRSILVDGPTIRI